MPHFLYVVIQTGAVFVLGMGAATAASNGEAGIALICTGGWLAAAYFISEA